MNDADVTSDLWRLRGLQQAAWQRGEQLLVESLLAQWNNLSPPADAVLELILSEYQIRTELRDRPTCEEYISRFPKLAERLQRLFACQLALDEARSALSESNEPSISTVPPTAVDEVATRVKAQSTTKPQKAGDTSGETIVPQLVDHPGSDSSQSIVRYTRLSEVGTGGLGKVWLAQDNDLIREVALKEVRSDAASQDAIRMLIKEAQITGQLQHPNIVPIYEVNRGRNPFYTMKVVKGETLSQAIQRHHQQFGRNGVPDDSNDISNALALPPTGIRYDESGRAQRTAAESLSMQRLLSVFVNVCDALAYAHSRGVIHRDLKPQNIVLGEYGEAIVLDWGLARKLDQKDEDVASVCVSDDAQTDATRAGSILGSPPYMSPEQATGQIEFMDQRTDVYGLGAILFEILTGIAPHKRRDGETVMSLLCRVSSGDTPHVRSLVNDLPEELDLICAKAMGKTREERYQSAKELKRALLEFQIHKESIDLASTAAAELERALQTNDYQGFSRALFGFEEALRQWPANARASAGIMQTLIANAQSAFDRGDYELAMSLLDAVQAKQNYLGQVDLHQSMRQNSLRVAVQKSAAERDSRQTRIHRLRRFGIGASLAASLIASIAALWINAERQSANHERQSAVSAKIKAEAERGRADQNALDADKQREIADAQRRVAEKERAQANAALFSAETAQNELAKQIRLLGLEEQLRQKVQSKPLLWEIAHSRLEHIHERRQNPDLSKAATQSFNGFLQSQPRRFNADSRLFIQPLGALKEPQMAQAVGEFLSKFFGVSASVLPVKSDLVLPASSRRHHDGEPQDLASTALELMVGGTILQDGSIIVGITERDLFETKLNYVFGSSKPDRRAAILSLYRLRSGEDERPSDRAADLDRVALRRALKLSTYLVAQVAGIRDFVEYECALNSISSRKQLDQAPLGFCPECERKIWWIADSEPLQRYQSLIDFAESRGLTEEKLRWENALRAIRVAGR